MQDTYIRKKCVCVRVCLELGQKVFTGNKDSRNKILSTLPENEPSFLIHIPFSSFCIIYLEFITHFLELLVFFKSISLLSPPRS